MLYIDDHALGNADEWSVTGLVTGSIAGMISRLDGQRRLSEASVAYLLDRSAEELFFAFYEWQWGTGDFRYLQECCFPSVASEAFFALPIGVEIFDGESVFAIRQSENLGRLVWQDFATKKILESWIDFDAYLQQWRIAQERLEAAMVS